MSQIGSFQTGLGNVPTAGEADNARGGAGAAAAISLVAPTGFGINPDPVPSASISIDDMHGNGIDDDTLAFRNWIASVPNAAGAEITIKGTPLISGALPCTGKAGLTIRGLGTGSTRLLVKTGYNGDLFTYTNCYAPRLRELTIGAQTQRTAGNAIVDAGGDATRLLSGSYPLSANELSIENVDMELQFGGLLVQNAAGPLVTPWIVSVRNGRWQCNGGWGVDLNATTAPGTAKFGATHRISDLFVYSNPTVVSGTGGGYRIRGTGDARLLRCDSFGLFQGMLFDPGAQAWVTTVRVTDCFLDASVSSVCKLAPDAAVTTFGDIEFKGVWFASSTAEHGLYLATAKASNVRVIGGGMLNCNIFGLVIAAGCENVQVDGIVMSSNAVGGAICTGNATDFSIINSLALGDYGIGVPTAQPLGIQIDAGCDHYNVSYNNLRQCATPITNTPGTSANRRVVDGNITL